MWLIGVAAQPHSPWQPRARLGPCAQMGAQKGKQSLACDFAKSCS